MDTCGTKCWKLFIIIIIIIIIIIMTLLDNTITGRTSSSHCDPKAIYFDAMKFQLLILTILCSTDRDSRVKWLV